MKQLIQITRTSAALSAVCILGVAAALLGSCVQDEWQGSVVPAGKSLHVSSAVTISGSLSESEITTRVAGDDVPLPVTSGSLGIFRSKGAGYTSTLDNKKYTYISKSGWQPATPADTLFLNGDDADVCAYYPYNSAYTNKAAIPLASGKYTGSTTLHDPNDICYDINRAVNAAKRSTTFEMVHALAMLELKITKDADYKGDCRITSVSILNAELITESAIDITTGTYATAVTKDTVAYNPGTTSTGILISGTTDATASITAALLVPFTPDKSGITLSFTANGLPVTGNIDNATIAKVEGGHRYSVKVTMKATSMQVTGVDMLPWDETGVGGDDYVWYPK